MSQVPSTASNAAELERLVARRELKRSLGIDDGALDATIEERAERLKQSLACSEGGLVAGVTLVRPLIRRDDEGLPDVVRWVGRDQAGRPALVFIPDPETIDHPRALARIRHAANVARQLSDLHAQCPSIPRLVASSEREIAFALHIPAWDFGFFEPGALGRLSSAQRLSLLLQAGHALQKAHEKGVLHLGLRPGNLLVFAASATSGSARVLLVGFGLAHPREAVMESIRRGRPSPARYAAPEQLLPDRVPDARSDVFGLGRLLHVVLSGTLPPLLDGPQLTRLRWKAPAAVALAKRACQIDPDLRQPTVAVFVAELERAVRKPRSARVPAWPLVALGAVAAIFALSWLLAR
jgi:hypothetical protein